MKINIIVANCFYGGIGKSNTLPFSFKKDLKYFSKITKGEKDFSNGLLMGRNTWESLPNKPLPKRHNYVISNTLRGDYVFNTIDSCIEHSRKQDLHTLWVIGGAKIYEEFILNEKYTRLIDYVYMTKIYAKYDCDVFFPVYNVCSKQEDWKQIYKTDTYENHVHLDFCVYKNLKKLENESGDELGDEANIAMQNAY